MENVKTIHSAEQSSENAGNEQESFDIFINTMVQIVEKYGKLVLQDLEHVA